MHFIFFSDTPRGYEPPGFEADMLPPPPIEKIGHTPLHLGSVNTGFHKLTCYGSGVLVGLQIYF